MSANVNKPVDIKQKENDINRKLQIYGIFNAFKNGKTPSNEQIDIALNSFLESKALNSPSNKLSADGKVLVEDAREVVKLAKQLLLSKNHGNLIQDFIWQTTHYDTKGLKSPNAPLTKDTATRDKDEALEGLRTLGTLLITNGQFRKLLKDASVLLRDMVGDGAMNAANKIRPSDEQLSQMDEAAPDNTWHEKPDLSKEGFKNQARTLYKGDVKQDAHDAVAATALGGATPQARMDQAGSLHPPGGGAINTTQLSQNTSADAAKAVVNEKLDKNLDNDLQEKAQTRNEEYRRRTREYLKKKMPQERRDQVVFRLKKIVLECQQHPDYMQAVQTLLRLAEEYGRHGRNYGRGSADSAKDVRTGLSAAEEDLRTLIERFANGTSTEDLWQSISQIYKDADQDRELNDWFKQVDTYIRKCLLEQGYVLEEQSTDDWNQLYDHGRYLLREKYRSHTDRVIDEVRFIADQFDQDPQNKAFGLAIQKLFNDLGNDEDGKPAFKPHLVKDLTEVIIPAILENIAYVPIPRIEYSDPKVDAIIENLVLESDNFMPNIIEIASDNYMRWGRKKFANKHTHSLDVKVTGIQMDLRDVSYHINRKSGFPSITDTGVLDMVLPGDGFSFRLKVSTPSKKDAQHVFKVEKVDVNVQGLKLKVKKSNHKLLFGLFKPLALKAIRPGLQKAIEKAIKDQCNQADEFLYQVKQEADRAAEEAKANPEEAPNIYMRYYNAMQKRILQGKEKAEAFVSDKKVNIAVTKQDSIFPDIHLPGGISSKATEYKELAAKGNKWESPVFSIGDAKKSTDIPSVPRIERKAHTVSGGHTNGNVNGNVGSLNGNIHGNINGSGLANGKGLAVAGEGSNGGPLGGHVPAAY
ncbi:hypothetical protein TRIATDRAFT_236801 [Trichoderma atroviride IMI 206040]|uniref:Uncharacterized protein n=1 Tax=Hypocrea atroviridis (strain ATCC 20476 / IMI 206040) TaxID=452589 RepID=G9NL92_HYPAI|nr:uncharacterized protein TRIATDRAFT_236801 [Trichoderma atroviride IMI 206040]EHK48657.1 hypothetical protein TRIATDRAFT_236801 [Trichoderma atroviride IMI 206040]